MPYASRPITTSPSQPTPLRTAPPPPALKALPYQPRQEEPKSLPYNEDAEICVLGSLLIDPNETATIVFTDIKTADFYIGKHRILFDAFYDIYIQGGSIDEVAVGDHLARRSRLENAGGRDYIGKLITKTPSAAGIEEYCRIVKEHSQSRRFMECIGTAMTAAGNSDMALALATIQSLVKTQETESIQGFHTVGQLMEMYGGRHAEPIIGHAGSHHGVLRRKEIMVVAAPSKAKKSWWLMSFAWDICAGRNLMGNPNWPCVGGGSVWYLDNELLPEEGTLRLNGMMNSMEVPDDVRNNLHIKYLRGMDYSIDNIDAMIRGIAHTNPSVIILDAIYKFYPDEFDENSNSDWTKLGNKLIRYASMANCAIVFAHHFAKGKGADKAFLDRAAGAGALVRTVDVYCSFLEHELSDDGTAVDNSGQPLDSNGNMQVMEFSFRSWRPQPPLTIRWNDEQTRWIADLDTQPIVKGTPPPPVPKRKIENVEDAILEVLGEDQDVKTGELIERVKTIFGQNATSARIMLDGFMSKHKVFRINTQDGEQTICKGNIRVCKERNSYRFSRIVRIKENE